MEQLEPRQLLAGVTLGSDGVLTLVAANNQGNLLEVYTSGSNIVGRVNATTKSVAATSVKSIKMVGGNWNDTLRVSSAITKSTDMNGGDANDKIYGGSGADKIYGFDGHDTIYGNAGNDTIFGDAGNDYVDGGSGTDLLSGGSGTNTLKYGEGLAVASTTTSTSVSVAALDIWDTVNNKKVGSVTSGGTIDLAKLPAKITLVAQGNAASVKFGYDANGSYRIENQKPWSISGDVDGKPVAWNLSTGSHTVKVTPYTKSGASGTAGATKTYSFNVIRSSTTSTPTTTAASISALELWDAGANKKLQTLTSGATIDLAKLPSQITLVAQGTGGSVRFGVDGNSSYATENVKPWAIRGDDNGDLNAWSVATGTRTVKVTPYTKSNAGGTAGATKTYTLNVIRSTSSDPVVKDPDANPSEPDPTPVPSTGTGDGTIAVRNSSAPAPQAIIIKVSNNSIHAGQSFHAHAMNSKLNYGNVLTARYVWNFGDTGSKYNIMEGFNASHLYANPGTYTVKLTVTNEAGKSHTASMTVNVQSEGRKKIYVSTSGSDSNDGLTEAKPIRSWDKARTKVGDNVEILFKAGQTFEVKSGINVYARNFVAGSYGTGKATLKYTGPRDFTTMLYLGGGSGEQTVENLIFDSMYTDSSKEGLPHGVGVGGTGNTVVNNDFRNLGYAVNAYAKPKGLLVQDNDAPLKTGLRGYFAWASGEDIVFQGNYVSNVDGHVVRMAEMTRINVSNNDFTNPNETTGYRGTLTIHSGSHAYVRNNNLNDGWFSVGPLGNADGLNDKSSRFNWSVFENNTVKRSRFIVLHGANHTMFRNNIISTAGNDWGIEVQGYNSDYGRGVENVQILNNTVKTDSTIGNFLRVSGEAKGIALVNNLYLAPNLVTGTGGAAPVFVYDNDMSSFTKITNNTWPMPGMTKYAEGGINYVWPFWSSASGYKTPSEWNGMSTVGTDAFEDLPYNSTTLAPTGGTNRDIGTVFAGVFTDRNGKIRSSGGGWTVGAVEV